MQAMARELGPGGHIPSSMAIYRNIGSKEGFSGFYRYIIILS